VEEATLIVRAQASRLEGGGITLGIENHDRFGCRTLQRIVQESQSPSVGICLDTANSLGAGEGLCEVLQVLGESTVNLHLKDFTIVRVPYAMGFVVEGRAAGEGMMDAPHLLREAARWNRCASAVVETWVPPESSVEATLQKEREWAERSVKYLQRFSWG
jgi:sugar phosphate isomerase/epimerase